jgi:hypothetical protein
MEAYRQRVREHWTRESCGETPARSSLVVLEEADEEGVPSLPRLNGRRAASGQRARRRSRLGTIAEGEDESRFSGGVWGERCVTCEQRPDRHGSDETKVVEAVDGMQEQVRRLAEEVEEMRRMLQGEMESLRASIEEGVMRRSDTNAVVQTARGDNSDRPDLNSPKHAPVGTEATLGDAAYFPPRSSSPPGYQPSTLDPPPPPHDPPSTPSDDEWSRRSIRAASYEVDKSGSGLSTRESSPHNSISRPRHPIQ